MYILPEGQGGHWLNKYIKIDEITYPTGITKVANIPIDTPFKAKIYVKTLKGKKFTKTAESTLFPKNWSYQRIQEEI